MGEKVSGARKEEGHIRNIFPVEPPVISPKFSLSNQAIQLIQLPNRIPLLHDILKLRLRALLQLRIQLPPYVLQTRRHMLCRRGKTARKVRV